MNSQSVLPPLLAENSANKTAPVRPNESDSPGSILKSMLLPEENILRIGIVSNGIYWKSIAMLFFALVFMIVLLLVGLPWQLLLLLGTALTIKVLVMFALAYFTKYYLLLVATDMRIIIRVGIINLEIIQMLYKKVESSEVVSTIPGRFLGYSSLLISGTGGHVLAIPFIENAAAFRKTVSEILLNRDKSEENSWHQTVTTVVEDKNMPFPSNSETTHFNYLRIVGGLRSIFQRKHEPKFLPSVSEKLRS